MLSIVWKSGHPIPDNLTRERLNRMRKTEVLTDMALMAEHKAFPCHKILLINASPLIRNVVQLCSYQSKIPTIIVPDSYGKFVEKLLNCVYLGFVPIESHCIEGISCLANQLQFEIKLEGCSLPTKLAQVVDFNVPVKTGGIKTSKTVARKNPVKTSGDVGPAAKKSKVKLTSGKTVEDIRGLIHEPNPEPQLLANTCNTANQNLSVALPQQKSLPRKKEKASGHKKSKQAEKPKSRKPHILTEENKKEAPLDDDDDFKPQMAIKIPRALEKNLQQKVTKISKERKPKSMKNDKVKPVKVSRKKVKAVVADPLSINAEMRGQVEEPNRPAVVQPIVPMMNADLQNMTKDSFSRETALVPRRKRKNSLALEPQEVKTVEHKNERPLLDTTFVKVPEIPAPNPQIPAAAFKRDEIKILKRSYGGRPRRVAFLAAATKLRVPELL